MRFVILLLSGSMLSLAGTWSGFLVDSKCYAAEQRNVNPTDTMPQVDSDTSMDIRYCSPSAKTKTFALARQDGDTLRLDSAGNAKALEVVRRIGKKRLFSVVVNGELNRNTISVDSLSVAK